MSGPGVVVVLRAWIRNFRETHFFRLKLAVTAAKRRRMTRTRFIAITGSSTKSTTSAILRRIVSGRHTVAFNEFSNGISSIARTIRKAPQDVDFVVLEVAAGQGTSVERGAQLSRPHVAIVTMIDLEHYSAFRTREAVAHEKGHLVAALPADGIAFLNADDAYVMSMAARTSARVVSFGLGEGADYRATNVEFDMQRGLRMSIIGPTRSLDVSAPLFGKHFYLPVLASVACALELGIPDNEIVAAVASYQGMINRCGVLPVDKGPVFVCDTQKAPYHSVTLPMDALAGTDAPRKTVVIGQISDFPGNAQRKYTEAISFAASIADRVYAVGPNAHKGKARFEREGVEFARFDSLEALAAHLRETAIEGEIILLKSAQNLHLERLAISFLAPVRCWSELCGQSGSCFGCRMHGIPRSEQPMKRGARHRLRARLDDGKAVWREGSLFARYMAMSADRRPPKL
jgi:UDP-N-acetylmuramoyl-tripeptide--D-alanyl-D-alanine ligase